MAAFWAVVGGWCAFTIFWGLLIVNLSGPTTSDIQRACGKAGVQQVDAPPFNPVRHASVTVVCRDGKVKGLH